MGDCLTITSLFTSLGNRHRRFLHQSSIAPGEQQSAKEAAWSPGLEIQAVVSRNLSLPVCVVLQNNKTTICHEAIIHTTQAYVQRGSMGIFE